MIRLLLAAVLGAFAFAPRADAACGFHIDQTSGGLPVLAVAVTSEYLGDTIRDREIGDSPLVRFDSVTRFVVIERFDGGEGESLDVVHPTDMQWSCDFPVEFVAWERYLLYPEMMEDGRAFILSGMAVAAGDLDCELGEWRARPEPKPGDIAEVVQTCRERRPIRPEGYRDR